MSTPITSFRGDYAFLSNFHPVYVLFDDLIYPTVENAFQAAKTLDRKQRLPFTQCTPAESKKMGRTVSLRLDWEAVKLSVMENLLMDKFSFADLQAKLLATGDAELIEGNTWGDRFWGKTFSEDAEDVGQLTGQNHLGKLLMEVRDFYYTQQLLLQVRDALQIFEDLDKVILDVVKRNPDSALWSQCLNGEPVVSFTSGHIQKGVAALERLREYKI